MKQKISLSEWTIKTILESWEGLIKDAELGGYNVTHPNFPSVLFRPNWRKNIIKLGIAFLLTFVFSPKGMFLDLKEGRVKRFFYKNFILFFVSIPFILVFFLFCFFILLAISIPIIALILHLFI